jgi:peptidyl-prolyl cis-trans isomerase C
MKRAALLLLVLPLAEVASAAQRPMPSHQTSTAAAAVAVRDVARVNGVAVTSDRVAAALSALLPQESFHRNLGAEKMAALRKQALATVIDEELAYQDGVRRGITASDTDIRAAWTQTIARYGGAQKFDEALRQSGVSRSAVEHEISRRLVVEKNYGLSVMDHCGVTRDEAQRFFADNPDRFVEPEQVHVFAITVGVDPSSNATTWAEAKARAAAARKALDGGTTFAEAVRTYSTDPSREKGGDMGFVHRGSMSGPFDAVVQKLPVGTPSDVIESLYGYHVVLVSEVRPPQRKTFEQVSAGLIKDLSSSRCAERKETWLARLRASARIETSEPAE